jgi:hypothetical protein
MAEALDAGLCDKPAGPRSFGQPVRLPRLEDQRPADITATTAKFDHLGGWRRRQEKRIGKLTDGSRR